MCMVIANVVATDFQIPANYYVNTDSETSPCCVVKPTFIEADIIIYNGNAIARSSQAHPPDNTQRINNKHIVMDDIAPY